jgi:glycosyltransferase involved in cell wall biosynthesis
MSKPKICILTETYYPVVGGGETQAKLLAESLAEQGYGVLILTRRTSPDLPRTEAMGQITVRRLSPMGKQHWKKWGLLGSVMPALFHQRHQYDHLLISGFRVVGISGVLACKLLGKKCWLKADSLGEMSGDFFAAGLAKLGLSAKNPVFRWFLRSRNHILRMADGFVAISSAVSQEYDVEKVPAFKQHHIPNSVDTARFYPVSAEQKQALRQRLSLPPTAQIVIYTGRLVSYKGLPLLLQAWHTVSTHFPQAHLLLVGSGGLDLHNCEADLRTFVKEHGLKNCVTFTGAVTNVPDYLQASDLFVFPTENEAFGISLIEAMACGMPAISTNIGGVKDIIENGVNGVLINAGDQSQLEHALCTLLVDPRQRQKLGQQASQTVHEKYTKDSVTSRYTALFAWHK